MKRVTPSIRLATSHPEGQAFWLFATTTQLGSTVFRLQNYLQHYGEKGELNEEVNAITPCYKCEKCQRGYTTVMLGGYKFTTQKDGNMAEYFHVNDAEANVALIPTGVSDEAACYATDMMSTGFKGAENAKIPLGGSGVAFGLGPVGLMAVAGTRLLGAGLIIAVDCVPAR